MRLNIYYFLCFSFFIIKKMIIYNIIILIIFYSFKTS